MSKRDIVVSVEFLGDGKIQQTSSRSWAGGVAPPRLGQHLTVQVRPSAIDDGGIFNPVGRASYDGGLQVIIEGDPDGYRRLGAYLLALAELDVGAHPGFRDYHDIASADGQTKLQVLLYRRPETHAS